LASPSGFSYPVSTLSQFLEGGVGVEQHTMLQGETSKNNTDAYPYSRSNETSVNGQEQLSNDPFGRPQPSLLTPTTQTLLEDFFNMPSPTVEAGMNMANDQIVAEPYNQAALVPYTHLAPQATRNDSTDTASLSIYPTFPMYQFPTLLPTGINLFNPAPPESIDFSQMFSSMDSEAAAYHFSLPLNLAKPEEFSAMPQIEQERQQRQETSPLDSAAYSNTAFPPPDPREDFNPDWFPVVRLPDEGKRAKDPIDVPPFVRDKLLRSFFDNLNRCPCCYVDRDRFEQRLKMEPEERPHPAWLFSMVSRQIPRLKVSLLTWQHARSTLMVRFGCMILHSLVWSPTFTRLQKSNWILACPRVTGPWILYELARIWQFI
jgi:hypothetical protein